MINLNKQRDFFDPDKIDGRIHIIGCGSVGSTIAENLARIGVKKLTLWDFDKVEAKNVCNQMFLARDIGKPKTEALCEMLKEINPDIDVKIKSEPWNGQVLSGYVFLCPDNIEVRKAIVEKHMLNPNIKAMFDVRTRLEDAQSFGCDWSNSVSKKAFAATMDFSHEEAVEATPQSACGETLGVATTVRIVSAMAVSNFIRFVNGLPVYRTIFVNAFDFNVEAYI